MQKAEERQQEKTKRLESIEEEQKLAETERNGLLDMNLEEIDRKLEQLHADHIGIKEVPGHEKDSL